PATCGSAPAGCRRPPGPTCRRGTRHTACPRNPCPRSPATRAASASPCRPRRGRRKAARWCTSGTAAPPAAGRAAPTWARSPAALRRRAVRRVAAERRPRGGRVVAVAVRLLPAAGLLGRQPAVVERAGRPAAALAQVQPPRPAAGRRPTVGGAPLVRRHQEVA